MKYLIPFLLIPVLAFGQTTIKPLTQDNIEAAITDDAGFRTEIGAPATGDVPTTPGDIGAEPALGNPDVSGKVLSSTDAGVRSWITATGGLSVETKTASFTAAKNGRYMVETNAVTVTDPSGTNALGDSYEVFVGSGTASIGGTVYPASRFPIVRRCSVAGTPGTWTTSLPFLSDRVDFTAFNKLSVVNSTTRNGVGTGIQRRILGFGDSIYTIAEEYLKGTIGDGGRVFPMFKNPGGNLDINVTGGTASKFMSDSRTWTVNAGTDLITSSNHGFVTGDKVTLSTTTAGGDRLPASTPQVVAGTVYYVIWDTKDTLKLATSLANAQAGTAIDFTDTGVGTHSIVCASGAHYYKSPNGMFFSVGSGVCAIAAPSNSGTTSMNGREVLVWYWSQTGGGSFTVEYENNASGTYTTLHATSPNATTITTNGTVNTSTGVVDATDGGTTGALKYVKYILPQYYNLRLRINGTGSTGAGQICAVGVMEVPYTVSGRVAGVADFGCAYSGTRPSEWDDISDASLTAIMAGFDPDVVMVRGYEDLADWNDYFVPFATRIRTIRPGIQFVIIGMHPTVDNQHNTLDATDAYLKAWCDANNGSYIPIRNRMGKLQDLIDARFFGTVAAKTITTGSAGVITTTDAHGLNATAKNCVIFTSLTGTSTLENAKWYRPYRVASTPTSTTFTLCEFDGTTPVSLGGAVTGGTVAAIDGTHPSQDGVTVIDGLVADGLKQAGIMREAMAANASKNLHPSRIQTKYADMTWKYAGPSNKVRAIQVGRTDGSGTLGGYYATAEMGANALDFGYYAGVNGGGMALTQNLAGQAILGQATNISTGGSAFAASRFNNPVTSPYGNVYDDLEIYTQSGRALAFSIQTGAPANAPVSLWRYGASNSSKGTEFARMTKESGLVFHEVTQGVSFKAATNGRIGTATLASGTVTITNSSITNNTHVIVTRSGINSSTAIGNLNVTRSVPTSFTITSLKSDGTTETNDASSVDWTLIERN